MTRARKDPEPVTITVLEPAEERRCDGCGDEVSLNWPEGMYAHELAIALDQDACVSLLRERDYCPGCLTPLWTKLNRLIGVTGDPWAEQEEGRDE